MEIDIAVDLMGFTEGGRPGIFTQRPAPIQVELSGLPGNGRRATWLDYLIADRRVVPDEQRRFYAEKIVYLPDSYLPTGHVRAASPDCDRRAPRRDCRRRASCSPASTTPTRSTRSCSISGCGCCARSREACCGCRKSNPAAMQNLAREAEARGVDADRLVFAAFRKAPEQHLARLQLADLFLDTLPYNAHTTASDALWAGVPVLTCLGKTFAGRVAGSLLRSLHLPELITETLAGYEAAALRLARDAGRPCGDQGDAGTASHDIPAIRRRAVHAPSGVGVCGDVGASPAAANAR